MSCTTDCIQPSPANAHCSVCHRTFGTSSSFDRHRRGGECLDPAALRMHTDGRGVWRMDGHAASAFFRLPQAAENGSVVPAPTPEPSEGAQTSAGDDAAKAPWTPVAGLRNDRAYDYPPLQETYPGSGIYE